MECPVVLILFGRFGMTGRGKEEIMRNADLPFLPTLHRTRNSSEIGGATSSYSSIIRGGVGPHVSLALQLAAGADDQRAVF